MRKIFLPWFIFIGCFALAAGIPVGAFAQDDKVFTVGISVWTGYPSSVEGFKEAMSAEGFIQGKNVKYLYGKSGSSKEKQREIGQSFRLFNALCFEVSPKCHGGRERHRDGKIWDSHRGFCLNLWRATEEEDGCHGKSFCALA